MVEVTGKMAIPNVLSPKKNKIPLDFLPATSLPRNAKADVVRDDLRPPTEVIPPKGWRVAVFNPPWCKKFLEGNGEGDFFPKPLMLPSSQSPKYEWPVKVHQHFRGTVAVQDARCITKGTII